MYVQGNLQSSDHKRNDIGIDLYYIEANYPTLWSEKACQLCYDSKDADTFSQGAFFASYRKGGSQAVSVQYEVSDTANEDDYIFAEDYDSTGTYTTADGVTLTVTGETSDNGYAITYARLITEYGDFMLTLRGDFSEEESHAIYDSLNLSSICEIEKQQWKYL